MLTFESPNNPELFRGCNAKLLAAPGNMDVSIELETYPVPVEIAPGLVLDGPVAFLHIEHDGYLLPNSLDDVDGIVDELAWAAGFLDLIRVNRPLLVVGPTHRLMANLAMNVLGFGRYKVNPDAASPEYRARFCEMLDELKDNGIPHPKDDLAIYAMVMDLEMFVDKFARRDGDSDKRFAMPRR
jgi:hypothetical protein